MWKLLWLALSGGGVLLGAQWVPVWVALAGTTGVAGTALVTWLLGRRRQSGTVRSSEAGELWSAYDRVMERVERDNSSLREENGKLRERVAVLEREVDRLLPLEREVERLRGIVNGHD